MTLRIDRVEGDVMAVNAFVLHGPSGLVVVDGMLTVSDARKVRRIVDEADLPLEGVVVTHAHPDHYAGLGHIVDQKRVPIVATEAVDRVIRRDDAIKEGIVGPMMGEEWPTVRLLPNKTVSDGAVVTMGGISLRVEELGPGESPADSLWHLDETNVFAGDVAYNGMHAYLADGRWTEWLDVLVRLESSLPPEVTLHVGHGPAGGKELLGAQRRYVETFVAAVSEHRDAIAAGDHAPVLAQMRELLPTEDLLFLLDLSIDPVHEALVASDTI